MRFFIVVPTFNAASTLEQCLSSLILIQTGRFDLRVHVQDGGSSDATVEIAHRWRDKGVTVASEPDKGIYDAINKAVASQMGEADAMTWLGADDFLLPGALATVASIFTQLPDVEWVTGLSCVGNAAGESFTQEERVTLIHREVAEGLHDGRRRDFIMQEGTFWRTALWRKVDGLDGTMRFAGDWDLWRRFAAVTPLYLVHLPLGRFTRRPGQTSEDMTSYYAEVDAKPPVVTEALDRSYDLRRWPWEERWLVSHDDDRQRDRERTRYPKWMRRMLGR